MKLWLFDATSGMYCWSLLTALAAGNVVSAAWAIFLVFSGSSLTVSTVTLGLEQETMGA